MIEQAQITVLRFPDNVRLRKEMYLIDPNHCIGEIVDNAVDEFAAGRCKTITVMVSDLIEGDFPVVVVQDDGGGIPTTPCKDPEYEGHCQAYVALGALTTSGKYGGQGSYKTATSGLHGVGAACVNAVSSLFEATIWHDNTVSQLKFEKGICTEENINLKATDSPENGTKISFRLDKELWGEESIDLPVLKKRLKQLAYLNPGLTINLYYSTSEDAYAEEEEYYYPEGLKQYFDYLTSSKSMLSEGIVINKDVEDPVVGKIEIRSILGYGTGYTSNIQSFVNNVTTLGGDHLTGFTAGVSRAINLYLTSNDKFKTLVKNLTSDDTKEGLVALISVKVMAPKFEGQSKKSIKMPEVRSAVYNLVTDELKLYMDQHPAFVKALTEKLEKAVKARIAAKRARDAARSVKSSLVNDTPEKLAACSSKKPEECEIFLVEGDSAAGSACQGRDSRIQAILPVFGKILNAEKSREDQVISNPKLLEVIKALKCGIGKNFDINKLRYHKIIIMADADVDGAHISSLWITFFYRYMPEIIEKGYLYIAMSPLYRVTSGTGKKETHQYFFNDTELENFEKKTKAQYHVSYLKGLGELQPEQLWESTMDPTTRHIVKVLNKDDELSSQAVEICMGENVDIRKEFIIKNADFTI